MAVATIPVHVQGYKCTVCVSEYLQAKSEWDMLVDKDEQPAPNKAEIRDSYTMAPSWQQKQIMGQLIVTCIPLPICLEHLAPAQLSVTERALQSGLAVPTA